MTLILSGTNGLSDVDGTAATPAIRGTDANTGMFFPAADTIAFAEGGAEIARFDSAGNLVVNNSLSVTGNNISAVNSLSFRNRIINGNMAIDQRNNGASGTSVDSYTVDRWYIYQVPSSKGTWQQNAGSVTPPNSFKNYLGFTTTSAYSVTSSDEFTITQKIEGFNVSDLGFGTASASTFTFTFWVRSSLTGTFGGAFTNAAADRSYPFSYTISAANTWEQKTITLTGDTTGTWNTTNGAGLAVVFSLGVGSGKSATAGSWQAGKFLSTTGATSVVGTNGATFYITGVQLEAGAVATPFEQIDYGRELIMCQRYFWRTDGLGFAAPQASGAFIASSVARFRLNTPVSLRATPTFSVTTGSFRGAGAIISPSSYTVEASTGGATYVTSGVTGATANNAFELTSDNAITLSAEL